jgi:hypothetical protein
VYRHINRGFNCLCKCVGSYRVQIEYLKRLIIMVLSIPIRILVSYDSTILLCLNDTYRDGTLIW